MSAAGPISAAQPDLPPAQRLALTRARLRNAWVRTHPPPRTPRRERSSVDGQTPDVLPGVLGSLLSTWWQQHPLRTFSGLAGEVAAPAARAALAPTAERHPIGLVLGAALAGALVVAARPWRWLPEAALSSVLLSTLWPKGQLQQWLSVDGLNRLMSSGGFATLLQSFATTADSAPTDHASPTEATPSAGTDEPAARTAPPAPTAAPTPLAATGMPALVSD